MKEAETAARLVIVCGLPGSGKTTRARLLEKKLGAVRLCPDEWMDALGMHHYEEGMRAKVEALQWKFAQRLLVLGMTVVIEWGTWGRGERDRLRVEARGLGALVELHYLNATVDVLLERIERRGIENPPVTREDLVRWGELFEVPTEEELGLFDACSAGKL